MEEKFEKLGSSMVELNNDPTEENVEAFFEEINKFKEEDIQGRLFLASHMSIAAKHIKKYVREENNKISPLWIAWAKLNKDLIYTNSKDEKTILESTKSLMEKYNLQNS